MKNILKLLPVSFLIGALIIYPQTSVKSAVDSFNTCINILMPSLFPFFVLSQIFISSGGGKIIGAFLTPIMLPMFNINGNGAVAFILGIISGYPIGSKTAAELYKQGAVTKSEADSLICFSNNSGPLFIMGAVGVGLLNSKAIGIFLYVIHILSAVTLGVLLRFTISRERINTKTDILENPPKNVFTSAVENGISSLMKVFAYVIFFGIIMNICESTGAFIPISKFFEIFHIKKELTDSVIYSVFELTTGIKKLSDTDCTLSLKLMLLSFMLGWSGFSIHFQTKSILADFDFPFTKYILAKFTQGIIAVVYTYIGIHFVKFEKTVFSAQHTDFISYCTHNDILNIITIILFMGYIILQRHRLKHNKQY